MTTIHDRPLRRETAVTYRGRPLIIELHAGYLTLREKGRRTGVPLGYRAALECAWKIRAREQRAEKRAARKRG